MSFIKEYLDLSKKQNSIRRDMKKRRKAISCEILSEEGNTVDNKPACIKKMDILGIGLDINFTRIEIAYCDVFCKNDYCKNRYCRMFRKNNAYINSVKLYESIRQAKWKLIKDTLKFNNR